MIELFPHQDDFVYSEATHTGLVAGFGAGKSFCGTYKTFKKKVLYPGVDVAYYLPTYGLIKDIAYPRFEQLLESHNIPYQLNKSDHVFLTPYGRIIMRSMDRPDLIIAYEVGYSLMDEVDTLRTDKMQDVFVKALARNRIKLPNGVKNLLDFVSTPEGFKFLYGFFVKNAKPSRFLIKGRTQDNPKLADSYIETLKESYTAEQIQAYLDGEFVNLTSGIVYKNYDRDDNNTDRVIETGQGKKDILHIGMDFNITKMSGIVHVIDDIPKAVEEIIGAYDTAEMIRTINTRYPGHSIVVYPDASGSNRSTSGKSDIQLLKEAGFVVRSLKKNPFIRDRVNAMNLAFCNLKGDRNYLVNYNNCPVYCESLEQQSYKNGEPDKSTGTDHPNDAGGYFIYKLGKRKQIRMSV